MKIAKITLLRYPVGENFDEFALSRTVKEIEANLCFANLAKIRKFKMAAILGEGKIFLKIAKSIFLRYPVGRKFRRNRYISHGLRDRAHLPFSVFKIANYSFI